MRSWIRHVRTFAPRVFMAPAGVAALLASTSSHAHAITLPLTGLLSEHSTLAGFGLSALLGILLLAALKHSNSHKRKLVVAEQRLASLEIDLNEAEASLKSDPHVLLAWRNKGFLADRMSGCIENVAQVPTTIEAFMEFHAWIEPDSAILLKDGLASLKETGEPFNFGIKTLAGELLDADGRTAGGLATLRIRPLAGERRHITELTYDARKLAKQVERLSAVLDRAPFPIWLKDKDRTIQWVNQAYVRATEASGIDDVLRNNIRLAKEDEITSNALATAQDAANGLIGRVTTVLSGSKRTLDIYEVKQNNTSAGFAIDVTGVAEAEKELQRHIDAHNSILNRIDTAIAIFGADQRLNFYNQEYVKLWKLEESWLQTRPTDGEILDTLRSRRNLQEREDYRQWRTKQLEVYTNLEPPEPSIWYLPDSRFLKVICEQHPFGGVTYLYENLTKEFQLESRYNELFGVQRETLDNLAEAVSLFGADGRLKLFNPAFVKFWSLASHFLGDQPHIDMLANVPTLGMEARNVWQDIRYSVTAIDDERKEIEGRLIHAGFILRYRSVPLADGNSLVTFADVSDTAKAEQALRDRADALEAADQLKTDFLQNVSYETRTPLTSILGFAESLVFGLAGPLTPRQVEYVRNMYESATDLKAIIDGIIDLTAIDAGAMELHVEPVDLAKLMELVAERASNQLSRRQLSVNIEIGNEAQTIIGDPTRLEQIFGHLLSNAIGFSPQHGVIRMGARRARDRIQLWVADQGQGIDPEIRDKAFERFTSKPLPGSHRGAGLGLAIVKSFTELHGGIVTLASKTAEGTTVVCDLPVNGPTKSLPDQKAFKQQAA